MESSSTETFLYSMYIGFCNMVRFFHILHLFYIMVLRYFFVERMLFIIVLRLFLHYIFAAFYDALRFLYIIRLLAFRNVSLEAKSDEKISKIFKQN